MQACFVKPPPLKVIRLLALGAALSTLAACANLGPSTEFQATVTPCSQGLNPTENTRLAAIKQMVAAGKFYAALAQLDTLEGASPQSELVRADALRRIDHDQEANAIYLKLAGGCLDGPAQHGLGLLAAKAGHDDAALAYFQRARQALPTDVNVRNDLGYALLLRRQWDAAQFEFLTVLDLSPGDDKASHNLVLLTFLRGQPDKARALAKKLGLNEDSVVRTERLAASMAAPPAVPTPPPPPKDEPPT